MISKKALNT